MRYSTLLLSAAAVATVCALPNLSKRSEKVWDTKGNLKLTFSKDTIQIGTIKIDEMFDNIAGACHESGQCETNDIEMGGQLIGPGRGGEVRNIKVTLGPYGEYPTRIRNGLVDTLRAAVKAIAKCEDITRTEDCHSVSLMAYCPQRKTTVNECAIPAYMGVNYQHPESANAAPPKIGVDATMEFTEDTLCEDMVDTLGTVAGAVNGVAGSVFTLFSYTCNSPHCTGVSYSCTYF